VYIDFKSQLKNRLRGFYRCCGGIIFRALEKSLWRAGFTSRSFILEVAGKTPRQFPSFQLLRGRMGRAQNPPPQLGHTFSSKFSTQGRQKVHSKLQIMASVASGGRGVLQFSQVGRSSSIACSLLKAART
jgi:hypothetical protein